MSYLLDRANGRWREAENDLAEMTRYAKQCENAIEELEADYAELSSAHMTLGAEYEELQRTIDHLAELEAANQALTEEVWREGQSIEALQARILHLEAEGRSLLRERNSYRQAFEDTFKALQKEVRQQHCDKALIFGGLSDDRCGTVSLDSYTANEGAYDCE